MGHRPLLPAHLQTEIQACHTWLDATARRTKSRMDWAFWSYGPVVLQTQIAPTIASKLEDLNDSEWFQASRGNQNMDTVSLFAF